MNDIDPVALSVFLFFFLLVTVMGLLAARWRRAPDLDSRRLGRARTVSGDAVTGVTAPSP